MSFPNGLLGGGDRQAAGAGSTLGVDGQLIEKAGSLQGLVSLLQQHGLGCAMQSWIGTGADQLVSSSQLGGSLQGAGMGALVQEAAAKMGIDPNELLGKLSQVLPMAVNHLTPDGQVPAVDQGSGFNLGMLEGLASKFPH